MASDDGRTHREMAEDLLGGGPVGVERASLTALAHAVLSLGDALTVAALPAALDAIESGDWDRYLLRLREAIEARMVTGGYLAWLREPDSDTLTDPAGEDNLA
jgi:hypothetical protein